MGLGLGLGDWERAWQGGGALRLPRSLLKKRTDRRRRGRRRSVLEKENIPLSRGPAGFVDVDVSVQRGHAETRATPPRPARPSGAVRRIAPAPNKATRAPSRQTVSLSSHRLAVTFLLERINHQHSSLGTNHQPPAAASQPNMLMLYVPKSSLSAHFKRGGGVICFVLLSYHAFPLIIKR